MLSESSKRKALISKLPTRYRQAIEVVEAAGGKVSTYALGLAANAKKNNLSDDDIIALLKKYYTSTST